ncbi:hypothetical protein P154DRAFT_523583 [Amniculicola lignicola CBS 123094]|uniref:Uncharacterized protein n=1 Tax=Amniculicola lignicola CBS 123094 TaxID=1392246 RepID=A0A6A5WMX8_9PLEO|nr:hypothetical protein P154DRAFT_523583 [Amniculicola lignicola CBS 123094]
MAKIMQSFFVLLFASNLVNSLSFARTVKLQPRQQLTFPPTNGPCNQNIGIEPLQCSDDKCLDIPTSGVCNIQTQEGLPICGCCDSSITLWCSACGGDAGGGHCAGAGFTEIAYQGCPCSVNGGDIPNGDNYKVCPEDTGSDTQSCGTCGGDSLWNGICDSKTDISGGLYRYCSCCSEESMACENCGGNEGNGRCKGVEQYHGIQYQNCKCDPNKRGKNPVIIPIPIPPPGYPIPPPGTPNPKTPCEDSIDVECKDCNGNNGWCQEGDSAGCPCKDEEHECPDGLDVPNCSDANCGGATNSSIISACIGDSEGKNKDCPCFQYRDHSHPYAPFTDEELAGQQAFLGQLLVPTTSSVAPAPTETGKLTCSGGTVSSVPEQMIGASSNLSPNQVLYSLRQVICTNSCAKPDGLPDGVSWSTGSKTAGDCEVSVAIVGGIEAFFYRGTESTGDQWQQCWDSTDAIIKQCVKEGPNQGWVNGPNAYQFYQGGFRPLNGDGSIHSPMNGDGLRSTVSIGSVAPKQLGGFTCGTGTGGVRLASCFQILGSIVHGDVLDSQDTTEKFCTDSTCLSSGNTGSSDGKNTYSSYCEIAGANGCSLVLATKLSSFGGFPGKSCVSPAQISEFIRLGANECGANGASGVWAAGFKPGDEVVQVPYTVLAMVDGSDPGVVYVP